MVMRSVLSGREIDVSVACCGREAGDQSGSSQTGMVSRGMTVDRACLNAMS